MGAQMDVDYCRISQDRSGAEAGVESQHAENEDFAAELGLSLARTYTDNDTSAFSGVTRPEYERLLADIAAGRVRSVVVWHANRLHRSSEEVSPFIRLAREHRVRLYSTTKGAAYNLEKASGRKELRDDTSEAEYESEHRGERVSLARKRQARNGDYGGGIRPYGWGVDTGRVRSVCVNPKAPAMERVYEDRPVLDMTRHNEAEAAEIQRWKSEVLANVSMRQLLLDMKARGVKTVSETDGRVVRRNGKPVEHRGWCSEAVREILTHPRTSGHSVYKGEIVKRNAFKPIIEDDERLALIAKFSAPERKASIRGNTPKWLGSMIYQCGVCNDGTTVSVTYRTRGIAQYRCRAKSHCATLAERADVIVTSVIAGMLSRPDAAGLIGGNNFIVDVAAKREELAVLETMKLDAARSYARRKIDAAQLEAITTDVDQQAAGIRAELEEAAAESPLADFAATTDARKTWDSLTLGRQREILRHLLVVTLLPQGRGRPFSPELIQVTRPPQASDAES